MDRYEYIRRKYNPLKVEKTKGLKLGHIVVAGLAFTALTAAMIRNHTAQSNYVAEQFKNTAAISSPVKTTTDYKTLVDILRENSNSIEPENYKAYLEAGYEQVARRWKGTPWNMEGHSLEPGRNSEIACGYFQIRVAEALGLEYNLSELGFQTITKHPTEWLSTKRMVEATGDKDTVRTISKSYLPEIKQYIRKNRYRGIDYFLQNSHFDDLKQFVKKQGYHDIKHYIQKNGLSRLESTYTFDQLEKYLNQYGDGAYSLAIDKDREGHVLTLIKKGGNLTILHSSKEQGKVVEEDARKVLPWIDPEKYYVGKIFTDNTLHRFLKPDTKSIAHPR